MTLPFCENLTLVRGDDWSQAFEFDQPISDFSEIAFTMRTAFATTETDNSTAAYAATLTNTLIQATGVYTVNLDIAHATALTLQAASYYYDIQVTTNAGKLYTTQRGQVRMISDVTR